MTEEEQERLKTVWLQLVKIHHPDRYHTDPEKRKACEELTSIINNAKDEGDLELLEEIAAAPDAFMAGRGMNNLDLQHDKSADIQQVWEALQDRILSVLNELEALRGSPDYDLFEISEKEPSVLDRVISEREETFQQENEKLEAEVSKLDEEIGDLLG